MSVVFNPFTGNFDTVRQRKVFTQSLNGTSSSLTIEHGIENPVSCNFTDESTGESILIKFKFIENNQIEIKSHLPLQGTLTII